MIKKALIILVLTIAIGLALMMVISNVTRMEWGHRFVFENKLGVEIDSLEITIGDVKTMILPAEDSSRSLAENIDVPKSGYPHEVSITIFTNKDALTLKADSFNCYNCDGSHEYLLRESGAEYRFLN